MDIDRDLLGLHRALWNEVYERLAKSTALHDADEAAAIGQLMDEAAEFGALLTRGHYTDDDMKSTRERAVAERLVEETRCTPTESARVQAVIMEHGGLVDDTGHVTWPSEEMRERCIADPRISYTPFEK